jgi:hypothetical protein
MSLPQDNVFDTAQDPGHPSQLCGLIRAYAAIGRNYGRLIEYD